MKRKQGKSEMKHREKKSCTKSEPISTHDPEMIFDLDREMREDDKEIVKFIAKSGGEALESELRKKFLQPRTTAGCKTIRETELLKLQKGYAESG